MLKNSMLNKLVLLVFTFSFVSLSYANNPPEYNSQKALEKVLQSHIGKVVYLDFWASWCGPCRKSFPWMNAIQEKYSSQGFVVVSVNLDANKPLATQFLKETPASFDVIYDPKGSIAKKLAIKGMPSSMIIGRDGQIKSSHTGFNNKKSVGYENEVKQLLLSSNH